MFPNSEAHPVMRMAEDMRDIAAVTGAATAEDLAQRGWTSRQIERHGEDARRRATRLSVTRH